VLATGISTLYSGDNPPAAAVDRGVPTGNRAPSVLATRAVGRGTPERQQRQKPVATVPGTGPSESPVVDASGVGPPDRAAVDPSAATGNSPPVLASVPIGPTSMPMAHAVRVPAVEPIWAQAAGLGTSLGAGARDKALNAAAFFTRFGKSFADPF
jgi:hypothetical protein